MSYCENYQKFCKNILTNRKNNVKYNGIKQLLRYEFKFLARNFALPQC